MKILSRNVNGLRAILKKGFIDFIKTENPDILGLQEIKTRPEQINQFILDEIRFMGYYLYFNPAKKGGYSGTAIFTKNKPLNVFKGIQLTSEEIKEILNNFKYFEHNQLIFEEVKNVIYQDSEGRVLTAEFDKFYFTTVYTPNSKGDLSRLDFRKIWDATFLKYMKKLEKQKPVVFCGDLNVAHKEIDLKYPEESVCSNGFTFEERQGFENFIKNGFVDTFRFFYPNKEGVYSWWPYFGNARKKNLGWRVDYILISKILLPRLKEAFILNQVEGSDHCPVGIRIEE